MGRFVTLLFACFAAAGLHSYGPQPFTLREALSAPYATSLTAAPQGNLFAWVEDHEGRHNLWVAQGSIPSQPRRLTHNSEDDAQDISQLAWSPDAKAIAYTYGAERGANGEPANPAHLQRPTPLTVRVQWLDGRSAVIGDGHSPLFTRDGSNVLFVHQGEIWISDVGSPDSAKGLPPDSAHQLVFDRGYASSLTLSPDGHLLAYISHRSERNEPSHSFLALYDLQAHMLRFVDPTSSDDSAPVFSPDGSQIAWLRSPFVQDREFANPRTSPNPWSIELADVATGKTRTLFTPAANKPGSVLPHLATGEPRLIFATENSIVFYSEADGWVHLYQIHITGDGCVEWLTPGPFEVEDATLSPDRRYVIYSSNEVAGGAAGHRNTSARTAEQGGPGPGALRGDLRDEDRRHLWRVDLNHPELAPVELTAGAGNQTMPQMTSSGTLAAMVSDVRMPMHPALIAASGAPEAKITPLRPGFLPPDYPAASFVTPHQVFFDSSDGLHLHGQLFTPENPAPAGTRRAAILFFHGGPERQMLLGYPAMDYYSNAYAMNQYLTSQGFIVLSVNYRCGIGYGLDFRTCRNAGATGAKEYNDVLAAVHYLDSLPGVDPHRVGIWGGSYGGYLTALALARNSNLFAAGVDFHGVHDWNIEDNASDWKQGSFAGMDAIANRARQSSPLGSIDGWRSPVLLIHGDNDPDVAYAQTPILAEALRARHVPVQELIFPDEVHGFLLHRDWLSAYQAAAAFFKKTLQP
ncbi:MAG: prolyl oligopeptidase family serine peptidase [Acidobacteriaceae bacterium]